MTVPGAHPRLDINALNNHIKKIGILNNSYTRLTQAPNAPAFTGNAQNFFCNAHNVFLISDQLSRYQKQSCHDHKINASLLTLRDHIRKSQSEFKSVRAGYVSQAAQSNDLSTQLYHLDRLFEMLHELDRDIVRMAPQLGDWRQELRRLFSGSYSYLIEKNTDLVQSVQTAYKQLISVEAKQEWGWLGALKGFRSKASKQKAAQRVLVASSDPSSSNGPQTHLPCRKVLQSKQNGLLGTICSILEDTQLDYLTPCLALQRADLSSTVKQMATNDQMSAPLSREVFTTLLQQYQTLLRKEQAQQPQWQRWIQRGTAHDKALKLQAVDYALGTLTTCSKETKRASKQGLLGQIMNLSTLLPKNDSPKGSRIKLGSGAAASQEI